MEHLYIHQILDGDVAKFSTWLTRIVVNNALKKTSARRLDGKALSAKDTGDDLPEIPTEELGHAYHSLDIAEIEEITCIPPDNIKMKLHRGRKKMYLALQEILRSETKTIL